MIKKEEREGRQQYFALKRDEKEKLCDLLGQITHPELNLSQQNQVDSWLWVLRVIVPYLKIKLKKKKVWS